MKLYTEQQLNAAIEEALAARPSKANGTDSNRIRAERVIAHHAQVLGSEHSSGLDRLSRKELLQLVRAVLRDFHAIEALLSTNDRLRPNFGSGGIWRETKQKKKKSKR